jgi:amino acid permease
MIFCFHGRYNEEWEPHFLQDTLKSSPPENKVMKRASLIGILTTTMFYMLCGCLGYAAFGNDAPGNFLTGFGFYEPFWLIDLANVCIAVHLIGAYQVNNLNKHISVVLYGILALHLFMKRVSCFSGLLPAHIRIR